MPSKKKTPIEQLKEKLISIKIVNNPSEVSKKSKDFDSKKFKELAQKVRGTISHEDFLRLEATL